MNLSNVQIAAITSSMVLLFSLMLMGQTGFTVPSVKKGEATEDEPELLLTDEMVLASARNSLDSSQTAWLADLDKEKAQAESIDKEAAVLKLISKTWIENGNYLVAGYYAKKVAELLDTEEAWSIAGTTYGYAFNKSNEKDVRRLSGHESIKALEKAKEHNPDNLQHAVNIGKMYLELSAVDGNILPMKGVRILQGLDKEHPNNVMINMTLGRLSAVKTRDLAKAKPRFENVLVIAETEDVSIDILLEAHYYLIECYKQENNDAKVLELYDSAIKIGGPRPDIQQQMTRAKQEYIASKANPTK